MCFDLWKDADPDIPILKEAKVEYAIYEVVGHVKVKIRHTFPLRSGGLSRAPHRGPFILTIDSPNDRHNG
jgi:hypothetical protein